MRHQSIRTIILVPLLQTGRLINPTISLLRAATLKRKFKNNNLANMR